MIWPKVQRGICVFFSLSFLQIYQLLSGARVFSPWVHQIIFSPKWEENLEGEIWWLNDKNAHVQIANGLQNIASLFSFSFLPFFSTRRLPLLYVASFSFLFSPFFFSFDFLGLWHCTLFCFHFCFFFFFFCLTRHTFFSRHNFYFFNKFGWLIFFFFLVAYHVFVLIWHHCFHHSTFSL